MQKGKLFYNPYNDRMDVRFSNGDTYGGLHCGTTMDVLINNKWVPTRIEYADNWYLVTHKNIDMDGLEVRL